MRITDLKATWLRYPIPPSRQHTSDFGRLTTFDMTLVRIETDTGLVGYGEAKAAVGSAGVNGPIVAVIKEELRPILLGQDPCYISGLWERMYNGVRTHYALQYGRSFPELGRGGLRIAALSGVDLALWDLLGKHLGVPVHQLLRGKCRETVTAYASGGWADAEHIGATVDPAVFKDDLFEEAEVFVSGRNDARGQDTTLY